MGLLFGFKPKQSTTAKLLIKSPLPSDISKEPSSIPKSEIKQSLFRKIISHTESDLDLIALEKLLATIANQLKQDEKNGIYIENYHRTEQTIKQLLKEKKQIETFRRIITLDEPAHLATVLSKLDAKIQFLQETLPYAR